MNIKEHYRQTPRAWVPVAMIPHYSKSDDGRTDTGGDSSSMRQCELIQACFHLLLSDFVEKAKNPVSLEWADGKLYPSKVVLACLLADQPECDKYCCNNSNCHHCWVENKDLLNVEMIHRLKTTDEVKSKILEAAVGIIGVDAVSKKRVVLQGVTQNDYQLAKKSCGGFHLMNNCFWQCDDFDLNQQIMRCSMHGIDLGIIKTIFTGCMQTLQKV